FLIIRNIVNPAGVVPLLKIGVMSVINYSNNTSSMAEEIVQSIIYNKITTNDKRLHIRVQPKTSENIITSIYLRNLNRFVRGKVIDISAGGLAVTIEDSLECGFLNQGTVYDPTVIFLPGHETK